MTDEKTEKATNSSLKPRNVDYDTDFKDCQNLQLICQNLRLARTVLDSSLDVAMTIRQQCTDLIVLYSNRFSNDDEVYGRCELEIQKIKSLQRGVEALLEQAKETMQLVSLAQNPI